MAKKYEKEMVFYVGVAIKDREPMYLDYEGHMTEQFINAKHFDSFDAAKGFVERKRAKGFFKRFKGALVVRSAYLEVNGFDIGQVV